MNSPDARPSKPRVAGSIPAGRATHPAPETKTALLHCDRGCGWVRHDFLAREDVRSVEKDGAPSRHILDRLIFVDRAGHERVWGNEGSQQL